MNLNKVEIDNRILHYFHRRTVTGTYTYFYEKTEKIKRRKYLGLFGPFIEEEFPILLFIIEGDVTNSKEWWREKITNELNKTERMKEINEGKLI